MINKIKNSALDLFGGEKEVSKRLYLNLREAILDEKIMGFNYISQGSSRSRDFFLGIVNGKPRRLSELAASQTNFGLCMFEILGKPNYESSEIKRYWEKQRKMNIIYSKDISLEKYVHFRAFEEILDSPRLVSISPKELIRIFA